MKAPVRVAVTGAAGQIAYSLLFRIASGEMLGQDQPVILNLLEITPALKALEGVVMEIKDCAYPLLQGVEITDDANVAFETLATRCWWGRSHAAKVWNVATCSLKTARSSVRRQAINDNARKDVRVLVIGNPANTNALIAMHAAPDLDPRQFTAMTRLDHNRAISQLADKTGATVPEIKRMTIWGNHSATQYPDISHCTVRGEAASFLVEQSWVRDEFIPRVQKRGAEVIEARGLSSAASAGFAGLDHMRSWVTGTEEGDWVSMGIPSDGSYGIPEGLMYSYPVTIKDGEYSIVQGLSVDDFSREKMDATAQELSEERDAVKHLLG